MTRRRLRTYAEMMMSESGIESTTEQPDSGLVKSGTQWDIGSGASTGESKDYTVQATSVPDGAMLDKDEVCWV